MNNVKTKLANAELCITNTTLLGDADWCMGQEGCSFLGFNQVGLGPLL